MSGPAQEEQAERLEREAARLRRQAAELASAVAATEEQVAATFEEVARHRPPPGGCGRRPLMPGGMPLRNASGPRSSRLAAAMMTGPVTRGRDRALLTRRSGS